MTRTMLASLLAALLATSCAGSVSGEVDGKNVPSFGNAAFGIVTEGEAGGVFGFALPGNSCEDGAEVLDLTFEEGANAAAQREIDEDTADLINERVPVGSWYVLFVLVAADEDDIESGQLDVEDQDPELSFTVCEQDDEAEVDDDGLDNGADCYTAREGEVDIEIDDAASRFRIVGDDVELRAEDDDDAGDVGIDIQFSRCGALDEVLDDLVRDAAN